MQQQELYEYAVIRIVPRVEREEFINAGIIVFCKSGNFLQCRTYLDEARLKCIWAEADRDQIANNLKAFEAIALGRNAAGTIAGLDAPSRFRWLTAVRSTIIQCSKVHPGRSHCLDSVMDKLFKELVL